MHSDVEGIQSSPSDDDLTGNAKVNDLSGNGGNDELAGGGGAGPDRISGDAGNDKLDSVNEAADSLGCGDGIDSIRMDPRNRVKDCESVAVIGPDNDGDGSKSPMDCDDANPDVKPGGNDVPGNGLDEDCDGADDPYPLIAGSIAVLFSGTKVTLLRVRGAQAGARVQVRCRGRGCPFKRKMLRLRRGAVTGTKILRGAASGAVPCSRCG